VACNEHLVEVAAQQASLPGRVIGVAFAAPESVALFERSLNLGVPVLCDPARVAYAVFGFGRRSGWAALLRPTYWWRLAKAVARGRRFGLPREDPTQLGGDVVLDGELRLRWIFRSRFAADRPGVETVRAELRRAASEGTEGPGRRGG
jgi:hypothetical protein